MLRRLFLILTLTLLFGLGQQGAAVHAISHLTEQQQRDKSDVSPVCDKCVVYAQLGSALGSKTFSLPRLTAAHTPYAEQPIHVAAALHSSYQARAPPVLS